MPLSPIGIAHTIIGSLAVFVGLKMLFKDKQITFNTFEGKFYLLATLFTAISALTIFKHGSFNPAHALAILTILAVVTGMVLERITLFKSWNTYFVNLCFSGTILFHLIPTATEILTRFPMDGPVVTSLEDPLLHKTFLTIFILFLGFLTYQMNWLRKHN
ncbi:hypothetical protein ACU6U9_18315 [Pseudomonas sp. HK3]|jgi:uncharacterized membrane protein